MNKTFHHQSAVQCTRCDLAAFCGGAGSATAERVWMSVALALPCADDAGSCGGASRSWVPETSGGQNGSLPKSGALHRGTTAADWLICVLRKPEAGYWNRIVLQSGDSASRSLGGLTAPVVLTALHNRRVRDRGYAASPGAQRQSPARDRQRQESCCRPSVAR